MNFPRRTLLKQAALLAASSALPKALAQGPAAEPLPDVLLPYLQNPGPDGMTVCILTRNATAVTTSVTKDGQSSKTVDFPATSRPVPGTPWTLWRSRITPLTAGTAYRYQVRCTVDGKETNTAGHTFRTFDPRAKEVKAAIFNDIHNRLGTLEAVLSAVKPEDYEFSIFNGDMINDPSANNGAEVVVRLWNDYVRLLDGSQKPILFVRGNHEVRGSFSKKLGYLFDLPFLDPDQPEADQQWQYGFTAGPVHFVTMDTGEDDSPTTDPTSYKRPRFWETYRRKQTKWLDGHLATPAVKQAAHRVFVSHIPLHNPAGSYSIVSRDEWSKRIADAGFSLMLAGHDHAWKFLPEKKEFTIGKGPGKDTPPVPVLIGGGPSMKEGTIILLTADAKSVRTKMYAAQGGKLLLDERYKV